MARALEAMGGYRVIRKLVPPEISANPRPGFPRVGVIVDTETTGLNHRTDEVVEIGAVSFTFNEAGEFGDVIGIYGGLQQPSVSIPAAITKLTGITDDMVAGQSIDLRQLELVVGPADLIIAHNAGFDRPFCERLSGTFGAKAWPNVAFRSVRSIGAGRFYTTEWFRA
ncbi:exonuclease domain-containing protein [Asticcacaulis taihuensis]|uniref:exonuclease domain-containing protein n=1 Tax=Asticcacaulis taihuensis TaxID=260084 RepID=UPI0026EEAA71|nr:exonuclease domain-containing protein [Asticcacaulis taihuensis]